MEVTFTTTVDDVIDYSVHAFWTNCKARTYYLAVWLLIGAGCFLAVGLMVKRGSQPVVPVLVALIGVIHLIATPLIFWRRFRRSAREAAQALPAGLLGPTTLVVSEASLTHITAASRVEVSWRDVESVDDLGEMVTVSLGGALPFLIPARGFTDPARYRALRQLLLERVKTSR